MGWAIINKLPFMKPIYLLCLFLISSCATKYLIPGNRFITPESQGGAFKGQFEFQQVGATQLTVNTSEGSVDNGVLYSETARSGFLFSNSLFNQFDLVWSHTGGANSMLGGKFQFLGAPRSGKGSGHKASLGILFGGNEHETDDEAVEFELTGREYLLLYGYRLSENVFPYASFSYASYSFSGKIRSRDPDLNGLEPEFVTMSRALSGGVELSFEAFFAKLEATYQQLQTDDTKDKDRFIIGYSLGFSW